jgi:hypothetical protein
MAKQTRIAKAQPKPLNQAWLILSNERAKFTERVALVDLFLPDTQLRIRGDESMSPEAKRAALAKILWEALHEHGFHINSPLTYQYQKQQSCIWCGGQVMTFGNGNPDDPSWETRCVDCDYLYDED